MTIIVKLLDGRKVKVVKHVADDMFLIRGGSIRNIRAILFGVVRKATRIDHVQLGSFITIPLTVPVTVAAGDTLSFQPETLTVTMEQ